MLTENTVRNIKLVALRDIRDQSATYLLRSIFRWYSEKFHTPLHIVDTLPLADLLQHYFEARYEDMSDEERSVEVSRLLEDPEVLAEKKRREDAEDADVWQFGQEALAQEAKAKNPAKEEPTLAGLEAPPVPAAPIPPIIDEPLMEDIHIKFDDVPGIIDDIPSFGPKTVK